MWIVCCLLSVGCMITAGLLALALCSRHKPNLLNLLFAGVFAASVFLFLPIHLSGAGDTLGESFRALLLSVLGAIQIFAVGCDFQTVTEGTALLSDGFSAFYRLWSAVLFVLGPVLTFGFVLSLFKNLTSALRYLFVYGKELCAFSALNEKSLCLASDLKRNHPKTAIVFADVSDEAEGGAERIERAKKLGAVCFSADLASVMRRRHSASRKVSLFAIGENESENTDLSLRLIEICRGRAGTNLYVFSAGLESELLLNAVDKGALRVRRINETSALVNRLLYERGNLLFDSAQENSDGTKSICAVVVGMGSHGTEMLKALAWYGQMDGYTLEIHAFDRDPLAAERFSALAPELMSPAYNGVRINGEAQYKIVIHAGVDVTTASFAKEIRALGHATFATVSLGDDETNIRTAVNLRMLFEQNRIHPVIQSIVYNPRQKNALEGIRNFRGQPYDVQFFGDVESSFTEDVMLDSALEEEALQRHLKWGNEAEFWNYEYNYRSSVASALHRLARIHCGIAGADKQESELTEQERQTIEALEHRRWNAYMRANGYIYSGSKDKSTRNDLAKMHHDLIDYVSLTEEEKRKDSRVGTR